MKLITTQQSLSVSGGSHGSANDYQFITRISQFAGAFVGAVGSGVQCGNTHDGVRSVLFGFVVGGVMGNVIGYVSSAVFYSVSITILNLTDALLMPAQNVKPAIANVTVANKN